MITTMTTVMNMARIMMKTNTDEEEHHDEDEHEEEGHGGIAKMRESSPPPTSVSQTSKDHSALDAGIFKGINYFYRFRIHAHGGPC